MQLWGPSPAPQPLTEAEGSGGGAEGRPGASQGCHPLRGRLPEPSGLSVRGPRGGWAPAPPPAAPPRLPPGCGGARPRLRREPRQSAAGAGSAYHEAAAAPPPPRQLSAYAGIRGISACFGSRRFSFPGVAVLWAALKASKRLGSARLASKGISH